MSEFEFYMDVLKTLEEIGARYMVVGAFGASAYGLNRSTHDADIIVDLDSASCDALAAHFPPPRYLRRPPSDARNSIRLGIMFNIIDSSQGVKADLVPLSREPEYRAAFNNRVRCTVVDPQGNEFEIWCARPEDIIVGKRWRGKKAARPNIPRTFTWCLVSWLGRPKRSRIRYRLRHSAVLRLGRMHSSCGINLAGYSRKPQGSPQILESVAATF